MRIRTRIQRAAPILGGKFTTNCFMHGENEWLDIHFLGKCSPVSYSLALQTTKCAYKELIQSRAWDMSCELAPEWDDLLGEATANDLKTGESIHRREPVRYPELDNMTRLDWAQTQHKKIADSGEIQVFEQWTLHRGYHSSIGLTRPCAASSTICAR
ncbi:MAG: hypothetical protein FD135_5491 [Comamonadaceae bacterium]|nr:MAG: hypothetical protein FD135_5491 [Comamonadaceae bacterium]